MKLKMYTIRLCRVDEYGNLIEFLRQYWSKKHVFCRNRKNFEFQHGDATSGEYDFIIAVHNESKQIHAVLGYISSSTYDGGDIQKPVCVSGALWKVRDDVENAEIGKLGLGVLYYLLKKFPDSAYVTLGLNEFSQQIYKALHFDFGVMGHYYVASKFAKDFYIAMSPRINLNSTANSAYRLEVISKIPANFDTYYYPVKNATYIANRYMNHPFYNYELLAIYMEQNLQSIWVIREVRGSGHKCIRIVDIVGNMDEVQNIEGNLHDFLKLRGAEFIDCYNHGISKETFLRVGFQEVDGETVIPNYYEPFEQKNINIHYASYSRKPVIIFKGDCDQDRPNLLDKNEFV